MPSDTSNSSGSSWTSSLPSFAGLTNFALFAGSTQFVDGVKLLIFGQLLELFRELFFWLVERFRLQFCTTAEFAEGDPVYEWMIHWLNQSNVWKQTRDFRVHLKTLKRRWAINTENAPADYVPMYERPRLFRWKGYWIEISRTQNAAGTDGSHMERVLYIKIYTLDMSALSTLIEEAKREYTKATHTTVTIYSVDSGMRFASEFHWSNAKHKLRRPLSSVALPDGMLDSLVQDARRFLDSEDWYAKIGVPYRRGYLLYGPPGAGKTSTIYALAGELNLEIYTLPLSANFVDDGFLQRAASAIPKRSILLIEDIDCAFPSRELDDGDEDEDDNVFEPPRAVTLSGLLNIIDGVGSEEGRIFFATTNYIDRLDPALIRPGRVDKRIEYGLATQAQAEALFLQIFPPSEEASSKDEKASHTNLAKSFAEQIPEHELSTAELQGFLLNYRDEPRSAVTTVGEWVRKELEDKRMRKEKEEKRKERIRELRKQRRFGGYYGVPPPLDTLNKPESALSKAKEEDATASEASDSSPSVVVVDVELKESDGSVEEK
ncbi:hypothetical protein AX16_002758 [Volvariella volvacea WC 439]|nr:hypothetical protein AX16_002758 [Volvariella volvacea WC 439]